MASYSGTIDLRVTGNALQETTLIKKRVNEIRALTRSLKPVPNLFDKRGSERITKEKEELRKLVEQYGKGTGSGNRFSNTIAGLNNQLSGFNRIVSNTNIKSDEFVQSLTASEKISRRLSRAEAERLSVLNKINTANTVGRAGSVKETLDLGKIIPKSVAGLEFYQQQLQDTLRTVNIGSSDYRELAAAIASVNQQLSVAQGRGRIQGPALPPGFNERGRIPSGGGRKGNRRQDILTGAGFPLLFGGGIGQAAAGGIGGAVGGLGGSIIASAIVSQVQQFVQGVAEAGQALDALSGDVGKIAEMTGTAGNESIKYAKALEDLGFKQSALQIAAQQAAEVIGTQGVGALQSFAEDSKRLGDATARVGLKIQAFFAQALGGFTNLLAQIIEKVGGAAPEDTGSAPARALIEKQVTKFNPKELDILRQEFEIKKLIGQEDAKQKQVAQAQLALSKLDLEIKKERSKATIAQMNEDIAGELQARNAEFLLDKKRQILQLELSQAEAAKRVFDQYTAQADALQDIAHQSKMRLNQETAIADARNKLTGAYYNAELKVNKLAIQRAKRKGDTNLALQLELKQVELIYQQTLAQIQAEVQRAQLKARQVNLSTKELEIANLRKLAEGNLKNADRQALQLQKQALGIANLNVKVAQQVADQQIRGAKATRAASIDALRFAAAQERAAKAAGKAANAMSRAGGGSGAADTWMVNGKEYTFQGSRSSRKVGSGINIIQRRDSLASTAPKGYAEGGFVTRPTNALIGERGENEYVIPESKMNSAINRYARGQRGESVVEGGGETSASGRRRSGAIVSINTGPVMQMDGQNYVTVSDLNDAVGSVAAAMSSGSEVYGGSTRLS